MVRMASSADNVAVGETPEECRVFHYRLFGGNVITSWVSIAQESQLDLDSTQ